MTGAVVWFIIFEKKKKMKERTNFYEKIFIMFSGDTRMER